MEGFPSRGVQKLVGFVLMFPSFPYFLFVFLDAWTLPLVYQLQQCKTKGGNNLHLVDRDQL